MAQSRRGHSAQSGDDQREEFGSRTSTAPGNGPRLSACQSPRGTRPFPGAWITPRFPCAAPLRPGWPAGTAERWAWVVRACPAASVANSFAYGLCRSRRITDHRSWTCGPIRASARGCSRGAMMPPGKPQLAAGYVLVVQAAARTTEILGGLDRAQSAHFPDGPQLHVLGETPCTASWITSAAPDSPWSAHPRGSMPFPPAGRGSRCTSTALGPPGPVARRALGRRGVTGRCARRRGRGGRGRTRARAPPPRQRGPSDHVLRPPCTDQPSAPTVRRRAGPRWRGPA